MPSHRYVSIRRGQVHMHGKRLGGAVAVLLDTSKSEAVRGGDLEEAGSNKIVGVITPQLAKPTIDGGKLLKHLHFGHAPKKESTERIHFLF